jgi:hypothetical protein
VIGPPGAVISAHGSHTFTARAGHHLPPRMLSSGCNVFEALGRGFTLLALDVPDTAVQSFAAAATAAGVPLTVVRDTATGERAEYGARMILVRPDQFVAWAGDLPPHDVDGLLARVTGRG